jgi:exodeoxyribonuclease V alpha subunit
MAEVRIALNSIPGDVPAIVRHFARAVGGGDAEAELAAALACAATQAGHVCADLAQEAGWGPWAEAFDAAARAAFLARLPGLHGVGADDDWTPLALDGQRLYLRRYRDFERRVAADLRARAARGTTVTSDDEARLAATFADAGQRQAARIALGRGLCLISGGPGTGKTHTLARVIGLLQERSTDLRIALAAPTGKAAARTGEALRAAGVEFAGAAQTLHRLLGMRPDGTCFHHRERPLAADVLVVDEASMIDLSLMARLLGALPATARLILLGDRDQLAAVEAGAVFADLCASDALAECVAPLATNFRFGGESAIGRFADALRAGEAAAASAQLQADDADLVWQPGGDLRALTAAAREGYRAYRAGVAASLPPDALFALFGRFRVLCAHRHEVAALNRALGDDPVAGLPLMVVRNDAPLRLFNGDIGLVLPAADGRLTACFPAVAGEDVRRIPLARLPAWEPAWAMTVHKSQGSEFERVLLALPTQPSIVATRELVYTGVTRARRQVELWAGEGVLAAAVAHRAERMSGLRQMLETAEN